MLLRVSRKDGAGPLTLAFEVVDSGVGFVSDDGALYHPFRQLDDSLTRRHGGLGIGLALSRQLVELLGAASAIAPRPGWAAASPSSCRSTCNRR